MPDDLIHDAVSFMKIASNAKLRIATAESCTGGLLASLLTDIEGASDAFDRGFVVYSEEAKCDLLGLDPSMIEIFGAVSEEVAHAMAAGALRNSTAHLSVAITGFAGPGGPRDEPGLVHFACAVRDTETRHCVKRFGHIGRGATRVKSLRVALEMAAAAMELIVERSRTPGAS
ncbi:MAG: CinA family protein [Sphingobium sp.]